MIRKRLEQMMAYLGCAEQELSVVFANERLVQELNRTYRHKDRPTNVLAFPQPSISHAARMPALLGDVVVALPIAAREATELQQTLEDRVLYLVLHGLLHLLGYDHEGPPAQRRQMEKLERSVLAYVQAHPIPLQGI